MIDTVTEHLYIFATVLRRDFLLILATTGIFLSCGTPVEPEEPADPITEVTFRYLQEDEKIFASARLKDPFKGFSPLWAQLVWYGKNGIDHGSPDIVFLNDNGDFGDILKKDEVYSRKFSAGDLSNPLVYGDTGTVYLRVTAMYFDSSLFSVVDSFSLGNIRPYIVEVSMPDTMTRPPTQGFYSVDTLIVKANDPNGLEDLNACFLFLQKPDSSYANNGKPIFLYDDGNKDQFMFLWDEIAGDSKFSRLITIERDNPLGTYFAYFNVNDKLGLKSETVVKTLVIIE